jgi:hypothetical protein
MGVNIYQYATAQWNKVQEERQTGPTKPSPEGRPEATQEKPAGDQPTAGPEEKEKPPAESQAPAGQ